MKNWKMVSNDSPGYVGQHRDEERAKRDKTFGQGNWKMGWLVGEKVVDYVAACKLYEDAYVAYLIQRPEVLNHLCATASEVYDDAESNVGSGLDYEIQETDRTHIQDIAIRNALVRLERQFEGAKLTQIRGNNRAAISQVLSPGQVPFHLPGLVTRPDNLDEVYAKRWWLPGSVEDFYQLNKRLFARA